MEHPVEHWTITFVTNEGNGFLIADSETEVNRKVLELLESGISGGDIAVFKPHSNMAYRLPVVNRFTSQYSARRDEIYIYDMEGRQVFVIQQPAITHNLLVDDAYRNEWIADYYSEDIEDLLR